MSTTEAQIQRAKDRLVEAQQILATTHPSFVTTVGLSLLTLESLARERDALAARLKASDDYFAKYPEADANGWIPLSKRKPTKEDANDEGKILQRLQIGYICAYHWANLSRTTHWKPVGPGPARMERK